MRIFTDRWLDGSRRDVRYAVRVLGRGLRVLSYSVAERRAEMAPG